MKLSAIPLLLLLAACQALDGSGNRAFNIPPGTLLDLHQDIGIPSDQAGAFIQGTRIGDRYRYDAVCRLEVRTVAAAPRTVRADRFTVERVNRLSELFSTRASGLRHARFSRFDDDGPHLFTFTTYLYLHSDRQPEVFRLGCSHLQASDQNPRHLTAAEIRTTLAPIMMLY
ncbi:MAG: hypothetical protein IPP10_16970 [Candidatus Competibacteraceae bacterium]|nr:hypothetical protein [Candidatus Competibacteraceae bacterium]MBK7985046.1 hypothetical protein [Candidatus Competibacteraceae bacterium]MBK8895875.1 hypothetical protein [Candidatus Competibacteraceae bacterium]MBK8962967.1 hypothetical protein [Candidatus Competibacteraceae bacterium]MBK9953097.1 hypothetical protein [Candidatus Competibacteraceae bacterium]